ncbi:uncharacterized protein [Panulirus ornatus]|uniref:uncharacterized protein isoform X2 n=1 Tax=Panulirus ornatus TaxID=150431 RepID=UPI003A86C8F4
MVYAAAPAAAAVSGNATDGGGKYLSQLGVEEGGTSCTYLSQLGAEGGGTSCTYLSQLGVEEKGTSCAYLSQLGVEGGGTSCTYLSQLGAEGGGTSCTYLSQLGAEGGGTSCAYLSQLGAEGGGTSCAYLAQLGVEERGTSCTYLSQLGVEGGGTSCSYLSQLAVEGGGTSCAYLSQLAVEGGGTSCDSCRESLPPTCCHDTCRVDYGVCALCRVSSTTTPDHVEWCTPCGVLSVDHVERCKLSGLCEPHCVEDCTQCGITSPHYVEGCTQCSATRPPHVERCTQSCVSTPGCGERCGVCGITCPRCCLQTHRHNWPLRTLPSVYTGPTPATVHPWCVHSSSPSSPEPPSSSPITKSNALCSSLPSSVSISSTGSPSGIIPSSTHFLPVPSLLVMSSSSSLSSSSSFPNTPLPCMNFVHSPSSRWSGRRPGPLTSSSDALPSPPVAHSTAPPVGGSPSPPTVLHLAQLLTTAPCLFPHLDVVWSSRGTMLPPAAVFSAPASVPPPSGPSSVPSVVAASPHPTPPSTTTTTSPGSLTQHTATSRTLGPTRRPSQSERGTHPPKLRDATDVSFSRDTNVSLSRETSVSSSRGGGGGGGGTKVGTRGVGSRRTATPASTLRRGRGWQGAGHLLGAAVSLLAIISSTVAAAYDLKPTTTVSRVVLAGLTARLPCELPLPRDRPTLILWYRGEATKPFYSYDARETDMGHHKVHEESQLGRRSHFSLNTFPSGFKARVGYLEVKSITLEDAGNYTCRVDFMTSQTMMSLLQLTVHEDIRGLEVFDAYERMIEKVAGPYELSSRVLLSCRAYGGFPDPVVEWISRDQILESSVTQPDGTPTPSGRGGGRGPPVKIVSVMLHLPGLRRVDNGREVTCVASSTNLTQPHSRTITLTMYLPPVEVSVEGVEGPLRAGLEASLICLTRGSRPPADLTWNLTGSAALTPLPPQSSLDQNTTVRRARLLPSPADHGRTLTCTATNPQVPDYFLAATHTLDILFPPEVVASLAPALDPANIKEGEDVYFECHIRANPPESRVVWLHQGEALQTDKERGILAQGKNLVLQGVSRDARGHYQCRVTNTIATVMSEPASLDVMFVPECRNPKNTTVSVTGIMEEVKLQCIVDSNPTEVEFVWRVNSSRGVKDMESSSYSSEGLTSVLKFRPHAHARDQDQYGVVFCLGSNKLGRQKVPCTFVITPTGPPEEPVSCALVNQSATSLGVSCIPGHDGGLSQTFLATVQDAGSQRVVANVSSATPTFTVGGLAPGRDYLVLVTAANTKGESTPYVIHGFALKVAENKINNSSTPESSSLLVVFVGAVCGFVLILTVLVLATRSRCRRRRRVPDVATDSNKLKEELPLTPSTTPVSLQEASQPEVKTPEPHLDLHETQAQVQAPGSPPTQHHPHQYAAAHPSTLPRPQRQLCARPQPLHSVDLPHITSSDHKHYTLKINCTRQSNESFV